MQVINDVVRMHFEVSQFLANYAADIESHNYGSWVNSFIQDGTYSMTTFENDRKTGLLLIHDQGHEAFKERAAYLDGYWHMSRRKISLHVSNTRLQVDANGEITALSKFFALRADRSGQMQLHASGSYRDRLRDTDDGLLFVEHRVVLNDETLPSDLTDVF